MKGIRHTNRSARRDETNAEMAPQAYGGAVISCAVVEVKPTGLKYEQMLVIRVLF
jgi:hypothetical protein